MGVSLLIGLLFLLFLLILIPIVFFKIYKKGHKKTAIGISTVLFLFVLYCAFINTIDSLTYSKKDARSALNFLQVKLDDDFKIIDNTIQGFPEYFQTTKIKISKSDHDKIVHQIVSDSNFKVYDSINQSEYQMRTRPNKKSINYFVNDFYSREYYREDKGYVPVEIVIYLRKNSDTLELRRVED